jgi:hypothetical protein
MRQSGMSYREIGRALNVSHVQAWNDVMSCIDELKKQCAEEAAKVKAIEIERLDTALKAIWPAVLEGDLGAIDRLIRIQDRRSRYEGLDAPIKTESKVQYALDDFLEQIEEQENGQEEEADLHQPHEEVS